jgi:dTDP-4-dehydrorhamnose reductase
MRILLTGVNGQLGYELRRTLLPLGEVIACDRVALDLANPATVRKVVRETRPRLIVNAAAYTAVDQAESEPELALAINATAPGLLAEEAKRVGASIVHYSTDYVFDGEKSAPYVEEDLPAPLNVYGRSKLAGEQAVIAAGVPYLIFRTSWLYGMRGRNFMLTIRRLAAERQVLRVVHDQRGAPTWSRPVAEATALAIARCGLEFGSAAGVYHLSCAGKASWYDFAARIVHSGGSPHSAKVLARVEPISSDDYAAPARRPLNSLLSCARARQALGVELPAWDDALALCLEDERSCCERDGAQKRGT